MISIQKLNSPHHKSQIEVYRDFPLNLKNFSILNVLKNGSNKVHTLGNPYSGKFIAHIPRWAIVKYSKENDTILDPFVGSGTTMVEARVLKRNSLGIDHNPLARLISKAKTTPLNENKLIKSRKKIKHLLQNKNNTKIELPEFLNRDFWFDKAATRGIAIIKKEIEKFDRDIADFFTVVLSETIHKVSKVAEGQVLAASRKNHQKHRRFNVNQVKQKFLEQLDIEIPKILYYSKQISRKNFSKIIGDNAEKIKTNRKINMIIASPPYINAHHYIWMHKLRLLQLGLVDDKSRLELMRKEIGTESVDYRGIDSPPKIGINSLDQKIKEIYQGKYYKAAGRNNAIRTVSTYQYFIKMKNHFSCAYDLLDKKSVYCLVVGDNTICGVNIPTSEYLSQIAKSVGFKEKLQYEILLKRRTLNMPRNVVWANAIKTEKVIIFTK